MCKLIGLHWAFKKKTALNEQNLTSNNDVLSIIYNYDGYESYDNAPA